MYNFSANPTLHHWANVQLTLKMMPSTTYFNSPTNLAFHNLCTHATIPPDTKLLLGLGPKFIPKTTHPQSNLTTTLTNFSRDIRLKYLFAGSTSEPFTKNDRKIYINSDFEPDRTDNTDLETRLSKFHDQITNLVHNNTKSYKHTPNLNHNQLQTLNKLKNNKDIVILLADKNLGPVVLDRSTYIKRVLHDHLLNKNTYRQLSPNEAHRSLKDIHEQLISIFDSPYTTSQTSLSPSERTYFKRALHSSKHRIPTFYGLVKVHKTPWQLRPVVSCCGSLLARVSSWVDYHLQSIRYTIPSFIKDSEELQKQLLQLSIPYNTKIFTCDAISMYTNIDIDHCIEILTKWFDKYKHEAPLSLPPKLLVAAITIVMKNNIFNFSDTFWIQTSGTAMGTPCACMIASLYFGYHEREFILSKYKKNILYYKRFIDDVICLWLPSHSPTKTSTAIYKDLQKDMNSFGKLKWIFEDLTTSTIFLDLQITLVSTASTCPTLNFKTYQKPLNLYLYIPPHSAHPPGTLRSLIHGLLRKYWIQNSNHLDFQEITKLLFKRLCSRGHKPEHLYPLFLQAANTIDTTQTPHHPLPNSTNTNSTEIFIKWMFHPNGIPRQKIQQTYKTICETPLPNSPLGFQHLHTPNGKTLNITKLTVAYTRNRNLRDILIPSKLPPLLDNNASNFLPTNSKNTPT